MFLILFIHYFSSYRNELVPTSVLKENKSCKKIFNLLIIDNFVLADNNTGKTIYDLRKKIQDIQIELNQLDKPVANIPELILSANILRTNEYLSKINDKQSELLLTYGEYSNAMEELLTSVFEIQNNLKEILKEQSSLISSQSKTKSKARSKKK